MKKTMDITGRYSHELKSIAKTIQKLKRGLIYELTGSITDEYLNTEVKNLEKSLFELIHKIEYGMCGFNDEIEACYTNFFTDIE